MERIDLFILVIIALFIQTGVSVAAQVSENDFGTILYTEAPKTWTVDIPSDFTKVEVGVYGKGEDTPNKYGGWNAYLKVNGDYAWKFLRFDQTKGGIIQDYIQGKEVYDSTGKDQFLDVTSMVKPGKNTFTYYHYTSGDGIGIKVKIYEEPGAEPEPETQSVTEKPVSVPESTPTIKKENILSVSPRSLDPGETITVTVNGDPGASYWIWIPSGEYPEAPVRIKEGNQKGLRMDDKAGPYMIGSYQFSGGNGKSVKNDVSEDPELHGTGLYGMVTLDDNGRLTLSIETFQNTPPGSYQIRIEKKAGSDIITDTETFTVEEEEGIISTFTSTVTDETEKPALKPTSTPVVTKAAVNIKNKADDEIDAELYIDNAYIGTYTIPHWNQEVVIYDLSPGNHDFEVTWTDPVTQKLNSVENSLKLSEGDYKKVNLEITNREDEYPDLLVSELDIPRTVNSEDKITCDFTVENDSNTAISDEFVVAFYISRSDEVDSSATLLNVVPITGIKADGYSKGFVSLTIPAREGSYWIIAVVDDGTGDGEIIESDENNNVLSKSISILSGTSLKLDADYSFSAMEEGSSQDLGITLTNLVSSEATNLYGYVKSDDTNVIEIRGMDNFLQGDRITGEDTWENPLSISLYAAGSGDATITVSVYNDDGKVAEESFEIEVFKKDTYLFPDQGVTGDDLILNPIYSFSTMERGQTQDMSIQLTNLRSGPVSGLYGSIYPGEPMVLDISGATDYLQGERIDSGETWETSHHLTLKAVSPGTGKIYLTVYSDDEILIKDSFEIEIYPKGSYDLYSEDFETDDYSLIMNKVFGIPYRVKECTIGECADLCLDDTDCEGFSWRESDSDCELYLDVSQKYEEEGAISGIKLYRSAS